MTTSAPTASPSGVPGANGECGYQHSMAPCLPMQGRECCSINGFCGSNETYCFVSNGCQYGCVDPASYYTVSTSILTLSSSLSPNSSTAQTTATSKPATTTSHSTSTSASNLPTAASEHSGLTSKAKIGVIVGTVGGVLIFAILAILLLGWRNSKKKKRAAAEAKALADAEARTAAETAQAANAEKLVDPALIVRSGSRPLYTGDQINQRRS